MTANVASEMRKKAAQHEQTTQARGKKSSLAIRFELVMPKPKTFCQGPDGNSLAVWRPAWRAGPQVGCR